MPPLSLAVLAFALSAAGAVVDEPGYAQAVALYDRVELEAAAPLFEALLERAGDARERAQLHAWLGLIAGQLGDDGGAERHLTEALRLDPAVQLPRPAPPAVEAALDVLRKRAALERAPAPATPASAPPPATTTTPATAPTSAMPVVGVTLLTSGAVVMAAAGGVALLALSTELSAPTQQFNSEGRETLALAYNEYLAAAVLAGVGAVGAAAGAGTLFASP